MFCGVFRDPYLNMSWPILHKSTAGARVAPNLIDYGKTRSAFSWASARAEMDGLPDGGLNIAFESLDRHVNKGKGSNLAIRWLGKDGTIRNFSYSDLVSLTNRFANVLAANGIGRGDAVFALSGRTPELYIAALGTLKNGSVFSPLFSAFGPEPIRTRLERGDAHAIVTTLSLYQRKISQWRADVPALRTIFLTDVEPERAPAGTTSLKGAMQAASDSFKTVSTKPGDMALLSFHQRHDRAAQRRDPRP